MIHFTSPAGWLSVHRDQLRAQRSVTSLGKLYLYLFTRVSRYQKGKTNLDFTEARDSEWQWHQLGHMQVCTSLQTDNHTSTPPLCFFTGRMPFLPPNQQRQSTEGTLVKWTNIDIVHGCHFLDKFIGKDAIKVGYIHTYIQIYIAPKSWERILGAVVIICLWLVFVIWYLYMTCYKFLTESNSERILKIGAIFGEVMGKS